MMMTDDSDPEKNIKGHHAFTVWNIFPANPTLTVAEANWTLRFNRARSQLKFRGGGEFDPLWRLDSPSRSLLNLWTCGCFSRISGLFASSRLQSLLVSPESSVFGGCRSCSFQTVEERSCGLWSNVGFGANMFCSIWGVPHTFKLNHHKGSRREVIRR